MSRNLMNNIRKVFISLALIILFASGCARATEIETEPEIQAPSDTEAAEVVTETEVQPVQDTVVIGQGLDAVTLDPAKHSAVATNNILKHMFDSLVYQNAEGEIEPALATSWELIDDLTWQFKLREGVTFHDGSPFTAEDVKFTFERTLNPDTASPTRATVNFIDRIEIVDDFTINIITQEPFPLTLVHIVDWGGMILPSDYITEHGDEYFGNNPVGTGPYKLVEFVKDDYLKLEAFQDYWGGEPRIKYVIFRPIPETSTRIAGIESGALDLIVNLPPESIEKYETNPEISTAVVPSGYIAHVNINTLSDPEGPMANVLVRQAMNYAIDVDAIIETIFLGNAVRVSVTGSPDYFGYDHSIEPYPYDPDKARELLAEAGYPDGFEVTLMSFEGLTVKDRETADAIAGYLEAVGIDVTRTVEPLSNVIDMLVSKTMPELFYQGWRTAWADMDAPLYPLFCCNQFIAGNMLQDPELDELILSARSTFDQDERERLYSEAMQLIKDRAHQIFLFQLPNIYAFDSDLVWEPKGDTNTEMWRAYYK